jgi:hypothetical protein
MRRLCTILEWSGILVPLIVIGFLGYYFIFGLSAAEPSGLPDGTGGFYQSPLSQPEQYVKNTGDWSFTLTPRYSYTLAGRIVGSHAYPPAMPDGIVPLDLAVVNGELIQENTLSFFTFDMGDHTLRYSYDMPKALGLTEGYIDEHISNNHLVFLNATLEGEVMKATEGSCIIISGKLVDIRGNSPKKSYSISTSTVRNDSYPAGCEIILVESYAPVNCGS